MYFFCHMSLTFTQIFLPHSEVCKCVPWPRQIFDAVIMSNQSRRIEKDCKPLSQCKVLDSFCSMYKWKEMLCNDMYHRESEIRFSPLMLYLWRACYDIQLHSKTLQYHTWIIVNWSSEYDNSTSEYQPLWCESVTHKLAWKFDQCNNVVISYMWQQLGLCPELIHVLCARQRERVNYSVLYRNTGWGPSN